ncbi:MAG: phospholipid carrier-dependent glycosyltransferase [Gemmatimonadetes bacterium]|nr:phospholipid carrier-dependent glycosyltransferase [Gemmatimonadota bacterium]
MQRRDPASIGPLGPGMRPSIEPALVAVVLAALTGRLVAALVWAPPLSGDAADYVRLAQGLISGAGFVGPDGLPTSWRPPLYPAFIAPVLATEAWWGWATALSGVRVVQALLSTGTVVLIYRIASDVGGARVGLWAAAIQAASVAHIAAVSRVLSETLFTTLVVAAVACLVAGTRGGSTRRLARSLTLFAVAGGLLGLAALTRSVAMLVPGFFVLSLFFAAESLGISRRGAVARGAALSAAFALVLAPWTVRNFHVHGAFVPVATQGGATLYAGNHPSGGRILGVMGDDERTRNAESMSEVEASAYLARATVEDLKRDPGEALRLVALKVLYLLTPEDWELLPGSGRFNSSYAFTVVWLLALPIGMVRPFGRQGASARSALSPGPSEPSDPRGRSSAVGAPASAGWRLWPAWALFGAWVAVAVVFYGSPRLRFPVEPMFSIGAAFGIAGVVRGRGARTAGGAIAASAGAALLMLVTWDPVGVAVKSVLGAVGVW